MNIHIYARYASVSQLFGYDAFFMFLSFSASAQAMIEREKNATAFISLVHTDFVRRENEKKTYKTSLKV
jgi:hypothetical protein